MTQQTPTPAKGPLPKKRNSLSRSLMGWFLLLALAPMILVELVSYQQTNKSLTEIAGQQLVQTSEGKAFFLKSWFRYRFMDLNSHAEADHNRSFITQLIDGLEQSGGDLQKYVGSSDWARRVDVAQHDIVILSRRYDYIFDLFLIDAKGNVLYSVARKSDLAATCLMVHSPKPVSPIV